MKLKNLTPHPIIYYPPGNGEKIVINPSGTVLRVAQNITGSVLHKFENIAGGHIEVVTKGLRPWSTDTSLEAPRDGSLYIVSMAVASVYKRRDFIIPDELVRRDSKVIGCRRFAVLEDLLDKEER